MQFCSPASIRIIFFLEALNTHYNPWRSCTFCFDIIRCLSIFEFIFQVLPPNWQWNGVPDICPVQCILWVWGNDSTEPEWNYLWRMWHSGKGILWRWQWKELLFSEWGKLVWQDYCILFISWNSIYMGNKKQTNNTRAVL